MVRFRPFSDNKEGQHAVTWEIGNCVQNGESRCTAVYGAESVKAWWRKQ